VLPTRTECTQAGLHTVRDDADGVRQEQRGDVADVGPNLIMSALDGGVLRARRLEFLQAETKAVHELDDVSAPIPPVLDDRELVDRNEVVVLGIVPVDQPCQAVNDPAVCRPVLNGDALRDQLVDAPVLTEEDLRLGSSDRLHDLVHGSRGQLRVQSGDGCPQAPLQDDISERLALR
jgi:hypothetical protein